MHTPHLGFVVSLALLSWACSKPVVAPASEAPAPTKERRTQPVAEPKAAPIKDAPKSEPRVQIPPPKRYAQLEAAPSRADLLYRIPKGWKVEKAGPAHVELKPPANLEGDYLKVGCRTGLGQSLCLEACTTELVVKNVERTWSAWRNIWDQPMKGARAEDDVKAKFEQTKEIKEGGLQVRSARITYTEDAKKRLPVKDRFLTRCTLHNPKDTLFAEAVCRGRLKDERVLKKAFMRICRSLEVKQLPNAKMPPKKESPKEPEGDAKEATQEGADKKTSPTP
jgi:hypothetical protein